MTTATLHMHTVRTIKLAAGGPSAAAFLYRLYPGEYSRPLELVRVPAPKGRTYSEKPAAAARRVVRRAAKVEQRERVMAVIADMGDGLRLEEMAAATGLDEMVVWKLLSAEKRAGTLEDRGDRGWFRKVA